MPLSQFFELDDRHGAFGVRRFDREVWLRVRVRSLSSALRKVLEQDWRRVEGA